MTQLSMSLSVNLMDFCGIYRVKFSEHPHLTLTNIDTAKYGKLIHYLMENPFNTGKMQEEILNLASKVNQINDDTIEFIGCHLYKD